MLFGKRPGVCKEIQNRRSYQRLGNTGRQDVSERIGKRKRCEPDGYGRGTRWPVFFSGETEPTCVKIYSKRVGYPNYINPMDIFVGEGNIYVEALYMTRQSIPF